MIHINSYIYLLLPYHALCPLSPPVDHIQEGLHQSALPVPPAHGHAGGGPRQEGPGAGQRPGLQAHVAPVYLPAGRHEGAGGQESLRAAE